MNQPNTFFKRFTRFCGGAAMIMLLLILVPVAVCGLKWTVFESIYGKYEESITFIAHNLPVNLLLTAAALFALFVCHRLIERFARVHLDKALVLLWMAAALFWVLGVGLVQEVDCKDVMDAAKLFARGNYRPMRIAYFSAYPYQLAVCLFEEAVIRLLPFVDVNLFMQVLNVVCSTCTMGLLCALAQMMFESRSARIATQVMAMAFVPMLLYNTYVYGTVPMVFLCSFGFFCFAKYVKDGDKRFLIVCTLALGAGYAAKQNALIPILALAICSFLHLLNTKDARPLLAMALALALGVGLSEFAVWQYEARSGMQLGADVSFLARLVMGLQESETCAGWFNGYTAPFISLDMTAEAQKEIASADLKFRLAEFAADPGMALAFFKDKYLSQWLEPGYSTLWWGFRCSWTGRFNGLARILYREGGTVRIAAEALMNLYQQALYILAVVGAAAGAKRCRNVAVLMIPVTVIGGFLYHMLFEAKSQYIFVYAVYLLPFAGYGLALTGEWVVRMIRKIKKA